jgi:hypothetical protein
LPQQQGLAAAGLVTAGAPHALLARLASELENIDFSRFAPAAAAHGAAARIAPPRRSGEAVVAKDSSAQAKVARAARQTRRHEARAQAAHLPRPAPALGASTQLRSGGAAALAPLRTAPLLNAPRPSPLRPSPLRPSPAVPKLALRGTAAKQLSWQQLQHDGDSDSHSDGDAGSDDGSRSAGSARSVGSSASTASARGRLMRARAFAHGVDAAAGGGGGGAGVEGAAPSRKPPQPLGKASALKRVDWRNAQV